MISSTFAKKIARRAIIAASAAGVLATISFISTGCVPVAYSQNGSSVVNCQGPGTIIPALCMAPTGSWLYTVKIPGSPAFQGVESYGAGGEYSESDLLSILPGYLATAGHGAWASTSSHGGFLLTYENLTYDANQNPTGYSRIRQTATIDSTGTSYTGSGDFTYYDTNGNAVPGASGTFTITAKKILVSVPAS